MKSVAVFCGSSSGAKPVYAEVAVELGRMLAEREITLVYGGGKVGLMGTVADAALAAGGQVVGVIPQSLLDREIGHRGVTELIVTTSMHERKATMERLAEGFIALPGGFGTLDEFCEILTWGQLGDHQKPCGLLDIEGYFARLIEFFDSAVIEGFIRPQHRGLVIEASTPAALLDEMRTFKSTIVPKWIDR
jgi:uncharacterized protein (TIGR00730 family)